MNRHTLHLNPEPYQTIASGSKTIESRLYDEKRQLIKAGDEIVFVNRTNPSEVIEARVTRLLIHPTFSKLFDSGDSSKFGGPSAEWLNTQISQFYGPEDQIKNGVVGIEFTLIR